MHDGHIAMSELAQKELNEKEKTTIHSHEGHDIGVIAQEIENVLPHAVNINSRGYKTVNYNSLIPLLIEAVKELSARVKELENPEEEIDG